MMINRRTFATLLAGTVAAPSLSYGPALRPARGEGAAGKPVFYSSIGPELTLYSVDVDQATLARQGSVKVPANIQYAWPHPSRRYFYTVASNGGPGVAGDMHVANAFRIDPASGALTPHGEPRMLPSRPINTSVDRAGDYLLTAYNDPSSLTVHRINKDGTLGDQVKEATGFDTGIYAHQIRATPSNQNVILVTRGNNAENGKPEDPGAIKTFALKEGTLTELASIAPGNGLGFGPRHLDFHPTLPFVYVSIERQNELYVYRLDPATGLSRDPLFVKETLSDPKSPAHQGAGAIHVHPNGRFVYVTNRASATTEFEGKKVFAGGENSVAVFAIDQSSGEPRLIQSAEGHGNQLRTFGIDPSGRLLVAASTVPMPMREGDKIVTQTAGLSVFRIGTDGKLDFVRKYDVNATAQTQQFWAGMVDIG
jgi:6-phosphogluconolactonase